MVVGVGDGPWDALETLPREMQPLEGTNGPLFHFVDWYGTSQRNSRNPSAGFAMAALANLPGKHIILLACGLLTTNAFFV